MTTPTKLRAKPMTPEQALWMVDQLMGPGKRWDALHQRVKLRRLHFDNDESLDPRLGEWNGNVAAPNNPYKDATSYQSGAALTKFTELIARLTENQAIVSVSPPSDTSEGQERADDLKAILNTWIAEIQEDLGFRIQEALSAGQIIDAFRLMEWGFDPECWSSDGVKEAALEGELPAKRARQGCPWWVDFPDITTACVVYDRHRKRGPLYYARQYEVAKLDYEQALSESTSTSATTSMTVSYDEEQAPGTTLTATSGGDDSTPSSSDDWGTRVTIRCLWTRTHYYEWENDELRKSYGHKQGRIRVALCRAIDTHDVDPVRRWLPALEGIYRYKPFFDRLMTLTGATAEMGAQPITYLRKTSNALGNPTDPLIGPDGMGDGNNGQSANDGSLPPGTEYGQIAIAKPGEIQPFMGFVKEEFEASFPQTGQAEIASTSAPWTARQMQQVANVFPKMLAAIQDDCIAEMVNDWIDAHSRAVEDGGVGEDVSGYSYSEEDGKVDRAKVITLDWKGLEGFHASVATNPLSSAEQTTVAQIMVDFFERGHIVRDDMYAAMNKRNPSEYGIRVDAEKLAAPVLAAKEQQLLAKVFGGDVVVGVNGQGVDINSQPVDPRMDLQNRGWKPQAQPQQAVLPGGMGGAPPPQQVPTPTGLPSGGPLAAPGTLPIGPV